MTEVCPGGRVRNGNDRGRAAGVSRQNLVETVPAAQSQWRTVPQPDGKADPVGRIILPWPLACAP